MLASRRSVVLRPLSDVAAVLIGIIGAAYFWKAQPVSLIASIGTAGVVVCSVMWLVMDLVPSFREIGLQRRGLLTALFGSAFAAAVVMLLAHGDLGEPRPELHGSLNGVLPLTWNHDPSWGYWLSIDVENHGGPSYVRSWQVFFVAENGRHVPGVLIPPPPKDRPLQVQTKGQNGDPLTVTYTADNALGPITFSKPIEHDAAVSGILVARFPHSDLQPPKPTDIQVTAEDRLGKKWTLKFIPEGPSL